MTLPVFLTGQGGSLYLPLPLCDVARRLPALHHRHSLPPQPLLLLQQGISPPQNAVLKNLSIAKKFCDSYDQECMMTSFFPTIQMMSSCTLDMTHVCASHCGMSHGQKD